MKQKTMRMIRKCLLLLLAAAMLVETWQVPVQAETAKQQARAGEMPANPVHHCTEQDDGSDSTDWSYIYFGSYPQTEVTGAALTSAITRADYDVNGDAWVNGTKYRRISKSDMNYDRYFGDTAYRYFKWERIKWRVLQNDGSTLFVMADKGLDCKDYNEEYASITWENCTLRNWLNNTFYSTAFSRSEQGAIVGQTVVNEDNPWYGIAGGNNTNDKVYLLSIREVTNPSYGFCKANNISSASRQLKTNDYAHARGAYTNVISAYAGNCWWWLRSPGNYADRATPVTSDGYIHRHGHYVYQNSAAVVPALHINLSSDLWSEAKEEGKQKKSIAVFTTEKSMGIKTGKSMWMGFGLLDENSGLLDDKWEKMSVVVSDPTVIALSDYIETEYGYSLEVIGKKQGATNITITDTESGISTIITAFVQDDYANTYSYAISDIPSFYPNNNFEKNIETNIYDLNGLYINKYKCTKSTNSYNISFDVYNKKYYSGAIDIYDENGMWIGYEEIDKYSNISSLWDTGEQTYFLISDTITGKMLTYEQASSSKHTHIDIEVPEGGYFTISNNISESPGTFFVNAFEILFEGTSAAFDLFISGSTEESALTSFKKEIKKSFATRLIEARNEGLNDNIKKQSQKIMLDSMKSKIKQITKENIKTGLKDKLTSTDTMCSDIANLAEDMLAPQSFNIEWKPIFESATGIGESFFTKFAGPAGIALKGCFALNDSTSKILMAMQMAESAGSPYVTIFSSVDTGYINPYGVMVNTNGNIDAESVLQVFRVSDSDAIEVLLDSSNPLEIHELYNICFVKDDTLVQPNGKVMVQIPIPNGMKGNTCKVYRQETNGKWTILDAKVQGNYLVFETNHFSLYALIGESDNLVISSLPNKISYKEGETLDTNGLVLELNGQLITEGYICEPTVLFGNGKQFVNVIYGHSATKFEVNVEKGEQTPTVSYYNVTYNANGGKNVPAAQKKTSGKTLTLSKTKPTRTGYTFQGWATSKTATVATYKAGGSFKTDKNITLYAVWKANIYKIAFNKNGGSGSLSKVSRTYGKAAALPANKFTRSGYKFLGWNTKKNGSGTSYANKASVKNLTSINGKTITLYAQWGKGVTVTYNANSGKVSTKSKKVYHKSAYGTLAKPTRKGYAFTGWYTKKSGGSKITSKTKVLKNSNHTLYAHWAKTKYKITYYLNGGKNNAKNPSGYYKTTATITLKNPTKTGYTFKGWYSDSKFKKKVTKIKKGSTGARKFYAKWVANTYTVRYNSNGGTGSMEDTTSMKYGTSYKLRTNTFKRSGYVFAGWATASDGKVVYTDGASVKNLVSSNGAVKMLYAKWDPIAVEKVSLNATSISVNIGEAYKLQAAISPAEAIDNLVWSSGNTAVATVSNGVVTGETAGMTTITVKSSNGKTASCIVTVKTPEILPSGVTLSEKTATIDVGKMVSLTATVAPSNATNKSVIWASSNTSVATVSDGTVTGKSAGKATITAATINGKTVSCTVTVTDSVVIAESVSLNKYSLNLEKGETEQLQATIEPSNVTDNFVVWSSADMSVATVDQNGTVKGVNDGKVTITVSAANGKKTTCSVTVYTSVPIRTVEELKAIENDLDGNYKLAANIDLGKSEWTPIGKDKNTPFTGKLKGNGYQITGLSITDNSQVYSGLFGYCKGTVANLTVSGTVSTDGSNGDSYRYAGGIAGFAEKATIEKCTNLVEINVSNKNETIGTYTYAGGIVGAADSSTNIFECKNEADIIALSPKGTRADAMAGGIVGAAFNGGKIQDCENMGIISSNASNGTKYWVSSCAGGIAGTAGLSKITDCINRGNIFAEGSISISSDYNSMVLAGGIAGHSNKSGNVSGENFADEIQATGNELIAIIQQDPLVAFSID
ncbi:MAG: hypothetical protein HFG49_15475 [Lachnospiraceae bacterium]|nr:hypothetical protein [Lachnospiraceae bacterium]